MKKMLKGSAIVMLVLFLSAGLCLAGNGKGGNGPGNGTGPIHDIYAGTPFTYEGDVVECLGDGMVIATTEGNVTVYGIGPVRYWEDLEVIRPVVGDTVLVNGYAVDYNGQLRNIAEAITVDGVTVPLRDPNTGVPLWRQGGQQQ